ncbi:MAG TPA: hypothetical protein VHY56_14280 [Candidatus Binataceae bacterium]|nr:hypothetical protein [Candidatus Binataceae bacterium]
MAFRILKFTALAVIASGFLITLCWPPDRVRVWAQLPAPNPLLAPVPPPSAPPQLAAPALNVGVPSLVAVPTPATPSPTTSARAFSCSCFGPGTTTAWMGSVISVSFFAAQQAARGACVAFNERSPSQPAIPSISSAQNPLPSMPGSALPPDAAANQGRPLPDTLFTSQTAVSACERCGCS